MTLYACKNCQKPYPSMGAPYQCQDCGGYFDIVGPLTFDQNAIESNLPGLWRYRHSFGLQPNSPIITLGEGNTPLVWDSLSDRNLALKLESSNPTGSYKDRGSCVLTSLLTDRKVQTAIEDSSGNAGASFSAYASRAGIQAKIFVPENASGPKRRQIEEYGAELLPIPGSRSRATEAALLEADKGITYASHAFMPFGLAGIATIAFEIYEELGSAPGTIITPVGHGGLLRGILMGFMALINGGQISSLPYHLGAQSAGCAPVAAAFTGGLAAMDTITESPTIAEGVRVRNPMQAEFLINNISKKDGNIITISEEELVTGYHHLAKMGIYAEPTSALVWSAYDRLKDTLPTPVILVITGSGLKYFP